MKNKKNVYELENEEKEKYLKEFNKTPFAIRNNKIKKIAGIFDIFVWAFLILIFLLNNVFNTFTSTNFVKLEFNSSAIFYTIFIICMLLYIIPYCANKIGFYRWLKIKHNIEY
jgi:hypothetical protein